MRTLLASALLALCLPATAQAPDRVAIDRAVARGVKLLKDCQYPDGSFFCHYPTETYGTGEAALALLALLKAGVHPEDPVIQKGFDWYLERPIDNVYNVSVGILALEALYTTRPAPETSLDETITREFRRRGRQQHKSWLRKATGFLLDCQTDDGLWSYPVAEDERPAGSGDLSNAQFAVLALKSAARLGRKIPTSVYTGLAEALLRYQQQDGPVVDGFPVPAADAVIHPERTVDRADSTAAPGPTRARGWRYQHLEGRGWTGSMTAAGVAMMVIAKSELEGTEQHARLAPAIDQAIRDGCAWLAQHFTVEHNPGEPGDWGLYWLVYYLYSLERVGSLCGLDALGPHDWYARGAEKILQLQREDGMIDAFHREGWGGEQWFAGTCLGILFLRRSTVPVLPRPITWSDEDWVRALPAELPRAVRAGRELELTLHWHGGPTGRDHMVFVHLVDPSDPTGVAFRHDFWPEPSSSQWSGSEALALQLQVPGDLAKGDYRVFVGLWDGHDARIQGRLPLFAGEGVRADGMLRFQVGELTVR